jgi:ParB-like chromosome segregation protein Spo0J
MADKPVKRLKKAVAVKKLRPKQDGIKSLLDNIERVAINDVQPHPNNPRIGDVGIIADSLRENGQFRPLVIQTDTKFIIAGNHTWLGARSLGWTKIDVTYVDVDDDEAERIMLADNKTAMAGGFDDEILARILASRKDLRGTAYDKGEVDAIVERNRANMTEATGSLLERQERERQAIQEAKDSTKFERVPLGEEAVADTPAVEDDEEDPAAEDRLEKASADLSGAFQLKPDLAFSKEQSIGLWDFPRLRGDMLMTWEELPTNLLAWAGSATKDWPDEDVWWLYNYGIDSTSGMNDISKVIISFYAFDQYFENWWYTPDKFVTKLLNSRIKYAVMPDFSMHTPGQEARVLSLWNTYRSRWLARYMQEAGLKIIPNITWATEDEDFLKKHIVPTLPKNIPLLAMQIQTVDKKSGAHKQYVTQLQYILDTVKPASLLLYYGKQGKEIFDNGEVSYGGPVKFVASRMHALAEKAKGRTKKTSI